MHFGGTVTLLLQSKETILTRSLLLCESSVKFAPNCKSLASNNDLLTFDECLFRVL